MARKEFTDSENNEEIKRELEAERKAVVEAAEAEKNEEQTKNETPWGKSPKAAAAFILKCARNNGNMDKKEIEDALEYLHKEGGELYRETMMKLPNLIAEARVNAKK